MYKQQTLGTIKFHFYGWQKKGFSSGHRCRFIGLTSHFFWQFTDANTIFVRSRYHFHVIISHKKNTYLECKHIFTATHRSIVEFMKKKNKCVDQHHRHIVRSERFLIDHVAYFSFNFLHMNCILNYICPWAFWFKLITHFLYAKLCFFVVIFILSSFDQLIFH